MRASQCISPARFQSSTTSKLMIKAWYTYLNKLHIEGTSIDIRLATKALNRPHLVEVGSYGWHCDDKRWQCYFARGVGNDSLPPPHMDVEPIIGGKPPKWMVKIMENPIKIDDLGVPLFLETPIYVETWVVFLFCQSSDGCVLEIGEEKTPESTNMPSL